MADRNPSKKRRQSQNRAAREARAARAAAADRADGPVTSGSSDSSGSVFSRKRRGAAAAGGTGRPTRTAAGVARATGTAGRPSRAAATKARPAATKADSSKTSAASASKAAAKPSTGRPTRPLRPWPSWLDRFGANEPGGRMVIFAFVLTLLASISACFMDVVAFTEINPETGKQEVTKSVTALHWGIGRGLAIVGPAPVAVGLAILLARPPNRRRTWYFGAAALFLVTMTSGFLYLAALGVMIWGCWQARKAALDEVGGDPKALRERDREALRQGRRRKDADDGVIEANVVDDEPADGYELIDDEDPVDDDVIGRKSRWGRSGR